MSGGCINLRSFDWRTTCAVGGIMGLVLLAMRIGVRESAMFERVRALGVERGYFLRLFTDRRRCLRYLAVVAVGVPIWLAVWSSRSRL